MSSIRFIEIRMPHAEMIMMEEHESISYIFFFIQYHSNDEQTLGMPGDLIVHTSLS